MFIITNDILSTDERVSLTDAAEHLLFANYYYCKKVVLLLMAQFESNKSFRSHHPLASRRSQGDTD